MFADHQGGYGGARGFAPIRRLKVQVPPDLGGALRRTRLLDHVTGSSERVVTIVAPAGYGKSTLLGQLASRMQNVAYLRLDETDDDPITLIGDLIDALESAIRLPPGARTAIATPAEHTGFRAPARFTRALAAAPMPVSLILDDCHLVRDRVALDWLGWIVEWLPTGVRLVLSSRRDIDLPLGRVLVSSRPSGSLTGLG